MLSAQATQTGSGPGLAHGREFADARYVRQCLPI